MVQNRTLKSPKTAKAKRQSYSPAKYATTSTRTLVVFTNMSKTRATILKILK